MSTITDYPTQGFPATFSAPGRREVFQVRRTIASQEVVLECRHSDTEPWRIVGTVSEGAPVVPLGGLFATDEVVLPLAPLGSLNYFATVPVETAHALGLEVEA